MDHEHAKLIDALGGPAALGRAISRPGAQVTSATVWNWKRRGIAWQYRAAVAQVAKAAGVPLPPGFLGLQEAA